MNIKIRDITLIGLMTALIVVGAFIKIPFLVVPITLQTLFVFLSALILDKRQAVLSVGVYLIIGLIGIPIFAKGGGPSYIFQPSFGYLVGFLFSAYFIALMKEKLNIYLVLSVGILVIYIFGLLHFVTIMYFVNGKLFSLGYLLLNLFLIFLPGDIFSAVVAILISRRGTILNEAQKI